MFFTKNYLQPLSNEQIAKVAPAVFAEQAHEATSDKYLFIPTINLVNSMRKNGWEVVSASQTMNRASTIESKLSNKHALFFAREEMLGNSFLKGDTMPLIKVENSHNGLSSFGLSTGFFRKACANGLTVPESIYSAPKVKHTINLANDVVEATYKVLTDFPMLMDMKERLGSIQLTNEEKMLLGDTAADIFFDREERKLSQQMANHCKDERYLLSSQLVNPLRYDDKKSDLWTISNVIQERLIKGLVKTPHAVTNRYNGGTDYSMRFKRKVTSIDRDREIHEKLFKLTQYFAKEKGVLIGAVA